MINSKYCFNIVNITPKLLDLIYLNQIHSSDFDKKTYFTSQIQDIALLSNSQTKKSN